MDDQLRLNACMPAPASPTLTVAPNEQKQILIVGGRRERVRLSGRATNEIFFFAVSLIKQENISKFIL